MQKRKKASIILSLHQEIDREVQELEKEIAQNPELDKIQVTEEMDRAFFEKLRARGKEAEGEKRNAETGEDITNITSARGGLAADGENGGLESSGGKNGSGAFGKIRAMDDRVEFSEELVPDLAGVIERKKITESRKTAEEETAGKVYYRKRKRKYCLVSLAAVLVIVLGVGVNSVGSKSYWKVLWERVTGGEPVNVLNVEDMEGKNTEDVEELVAYREIKEKLKVEPVRIFYKPGGMKLVDYKIYEEMLAAQLMYKYQDSVFRYVLYVNSSDSSWGEKKEDDKIDEYILSVNDMKILIEEFQVHDSLYNRQTANFEYQGVNYQLSGAMEKDEFKKMIENLFFF